MPVCPQTPNREDFRVTSPVGRPKWPNAAAITSDEARRTRKDPPDRRDLFFCGQFEFFLGVICPCYSTAKKYKQIKKRRGKKMFVYVRVGEDSLTKEKNRSP